MTARDEQRRGARRTERVGAEPALEARASVARRVVLDVSCIGNVGGVRVVCRWMLGGRGYVGVRARRCAVSGRSVDSRGDASRASEARGRSDEAIARAMTKLRSGGYAAANCDVQAPAASLCPPHGRM
eukprot:21601-Pleurochrysis_carterae.AAC.1